MTKYPQICAGIAALVISSPNVFAADPAASNSSSSTTTDNSSAGGSTSQSRSGLLERRQQRRQQRKERITDLLKGTSPPSPKEVMSLSTLSADQRKSIQAIYQGEPERPLKKQIWELHQQLRASKASQGTSTSSNSQGASTSTAKGTSTSTAKGASTTAASTDSTSSMSPLDIHKKIKDLRLQLADQRLKTWERVKAKLTPDQIKQAQQLHSQTKSMIGTSSPAPSDASVSGSTK